ncbi:MAG: hypothetical protein DRH26_01080 [Deltaproteobacteria bacterium]|nr:MAG: hypothetical protein DRH26_01080 [Deltaproteobacteria bacterium]
MTEETNDVVEQEKESAPNELDMLKERANIMGITFHPNIGVDKLKAKILEKTEPKVKSAITQDTLDEEIKTIAAAGVAYDGLIGSPESPAQRAARKRHEALRLVRVRVSDMNPINSNLKGALFSVGNSKLGMIKKFVPFNAENGWHVPNIILREMQSKKYMAHYEVRIGGKRVKRHKLIPQYAIEIMPPLTAKELDELKQRQIIAGN